MNKEFNAWMRDYSNRSKYGLDPERRFVKHQTTIGMTLRRWLFWLSFIAIFVYWRTR